MDSLDLKVSFCAVTRKMRKLAEPNTLRKKKDLWTICWALKLPKDFLFKQQLSSD